MGILRSSRRLVQAERWRYDLAYGGVAATYADKVLGIDPSIIAYWPLWETSGSVAEDKVADLRAPDPSSLDGTYTSVTLANGIGPDGSPCPLFDGIDDFVDVFSAALDGAYNGAELTAMIWARPFNPGVWSDTTERYCLNLYEDDNNRHEIKSAADDNFYWINRAGGIWKSVSQAQAAYDTTWAHYALTTSETADQFKAYRNGVQVGATVGGLGIYAGALSTAFIGALNAVPASLWYGWQAHCAIFGSALAQPIIADLAIPTP